MAREMQFLASRNASKYSKASHCQIFQKRLFWYLLAITDIHISFTTSQYSLSSFMCLQCLDIIGWASGTASGL